MTTATLTLIMAALKGVGFDVNVVKHFPPDADGYGGWSFYRKEPPTDHQLDIFDYAEVTILQNADNTYRVYVESCTPGTYWQPPDYEMIPVTKNRKTPQLACAELITVCIKDMAFEFLPL